MSVATPDQELVEREPELAALRGVLARLEGGEGGIVVVEAPAGHGKTALLRALRADAQAAGVRVLRAAGAELERDFPFGIVRQLLEPALRACDERRRAELFEGAAQLAEPVFAGHAEADTGDASFGRLHGLYWLTANLAEAEPLVLVVDDAHWADAPSMRYLDVLARRLEGLPVVLAIGAREAEPGAQQEVLDDLVGAPEALVLRPRPLSGAAVGEILEQALGDGVETAFAAVAAHSTGGNPLLVRELLRTVAEEGFAGRSEEAERLREALPANVGRIVIGRLRRLSPDALALARAVAVLGDGARFADAAELAEVAAQDATAAHGALVRAGLLDAGELRFVHPVVRSAVHADLTGGLRGDWHRRAAALRAGAGAGASEVAAHLVQTEPGGEPWAAETLAAAGRRALLDGAPDVALRHLRRALAEPPEPAARPAVLLALGHAAARAGAPDAAEHLEAAARLAGPPLAVEAERLRAQVLVLQEHAADAAEVLRRAAAAAAERGDPVAPELENDLVDVLAHVEPLRDEYLRRLEALEAQDRPTLLAHLAWVRAIGGAPAAEVRELARRALTAGGFVHFYALEALMNVEAADECAAALRDATAMAERLGSTVAAGPLTYMTTAWGAWERSFGDLRHAEELARYALDVMLMTRAPAAVVSVRSNLAQILVDRGRLDEADAELARLPSRETGQGIREIHAIRARLRVHQGRNEEALAELELELAQERRRGWAIGNREPSRATLVRALVALGRTAEARPIADEQVALAERRGVAGAEARARVARALTLRGDDALEELRTAAEVARRSPARIVRAEALGELGAALRRAGDRTAAREPLAEARELAHRCGAGGLEERIHEELVVAGARPRRVALSGVESLTAAERRVAELAAQGMRNRDIAQTLFVTLKTVEVHLGRTYGKLGIRARSQLAGALAADG